MACPLMKSIRFVEGAQANIVFFIQGQVGVWEWRFWIIFSGQRKYCRCPRYYRHVLAANLACCQLHTDKHAFCERDRRGPGEEGLTYSKAKVTKLLRFNRPSL